MRCPRMLNPGWLTAAVLVLAMASSSPGLEIGVGLSRSKDPKAAGAEAARKAKTALGDRKPKLVLVFDCGGRRGMMLKNKNFPKELEAMKEVAGSAPIFGFYGSGEIGQAGCDSPAHGVGYHISACAIITK